MLEGITAGFILSLSLYPGTVWLAKVGRCGRVAQVLGVGIGLGLSQMLWLIVAVPGLMLMVMNLSGLKTIMHGFAAFVLFYMALKFFRSKRATTLSDAEGLGTPWSMFAEAFKRAFAMPLRLPAAVAILLATGVYVNRPAAPSTVPDVMMGALIGVVWWWGQFTFLAAVFAGRVPEAITLKSLNKIRPLCTVLFAFLGVVVIYLAG